MPEYSQAFNPGTSVTCSGTSTSVVSENNNRERILLQNVHATQHIYLKFGTAAAEVDKGHRLTAAGGSLNLEGYTGPIQAIASGASTPLLVAEF